LKQLFELTMRLMSAGSPCHESISGFAWHLIQAFADPLASCRFEEGDVVYGPNEYALQVVAPRRGAVGRGQEQQDSVFADNWNSPVEFDIWHGKHQSLRRVKTTQGCLYTLLWKGDLNALDMPNPKPPLLAQALAEGLHLLAADVKPLLPDRAAGGWAFLMPYCSVTKRLGTKTRIVAAALARHGANHGTLRLEKLGCPNYDAFAPTVEIAWFTSREALSRHTLETTLKAVLHKPNKDKKTDRDGWLLKRHGHFANFEP